MSDEHQPDPILATLACDPVRCGSGNWSSRIAKVPVSLLEDDKDRVWATNSGAVRLTANSHLEEEIEYHADSKLSCLIGNTREVKDGDWLLATEPIRHRSDERIHIPARIGDELEKKLKPVVEQAKPENLRSAAVVSVCWSLIRCRGPWVVGLEMSGAQCCGIAFIPDSDGGGIGLLVSRLVVLVVERVPDDVDVERDRRVGGHGRRVELKPTRLLDKALALYTGKLREAFGRRGAACSPGEDP